MYFCSSGVFQSTLPHGERRSSRRIFPARKYFNPRSRMGSDEICPVTSAKEFISIHAPRMGSDPPIRAKMTTSHIFQSTLPHGERQIAILGIPLLITISIHAPAWGATSMFVIASNDISISIHAPAWGATLYTGGVPLCLYISIHAPAWGATSFPRIDSLQASFQSTLPHGERQQKHEISSLFL